MVRRNFLETDVHAGGKSFFCVIDMISSTDGMLRVVNVMLISLSLSAVDVCAMEVCKSGWPCSVKAKR